MLDMGGTPSANNDQSLIRTANASKNSRLQAVAFDFRTLINTKDSHEIGSDDLANETRPPAQKGEEISEESIIDIDRVQEVADLLNINVDSSPNGAVGHHSTTSTPKQLRKMKESKLKDHDPSAHDIRAKYASKLKGGLAGIELAKSQVEETLISGDAAGHLQARKIAIMDGVASNPDDSKVANRWLPSQAATQLLTLLTHRSIRIVLLPTIGTKKDGDEPSMEDFKTQLKNVIIDNILPEPDDSEGNDGIEKLLKEGVLDELDVHSQNVLVVSDRDAYLRVARDMGMGICRLQAKNARRGSITAHYTVQTIGEVQDIVNEINGISFNTVLNR